MQCMCSAIHPSSKRMAFSAFHIWLVCVRARVCVCVCVCVIINRAYICMYSLAFSAPNCSDMILNATYDMVFLVDMTTNTAARDAQSVRS